MGDKQARRTGTPPTAHRRHAGARAARTETTPEGRYGRTDSTNRAPRRISPPKNTTKPLRSHRSQQTQPQGKTKDRAALPGARQRARAAKPPQPPEASTSSKKKAADATPPLPSHPARKQHDPPRSGPAPPPNTKQPSTPKPTPRTMHSTAHHRHPSQQSEATPSTRGASRRDAPNQPTTDTHEPRPQARPPMYPPGRRNHAKRHGQPLKPGTKRRGTPRRPAEQKHPGQHHKRSSPYPRTKEAPIAVR
ncbi:PREDICTED: extensin-like [Cyprinodon variegatus]|uniref:extensin-like n=1 Tax=Cyprinodon variegatus TaxID=28743 RepID=UPI0007426951|nr:PREDICTED: extensin-like [Cyprinodon variegatus]